MDNGRLIKMMQVMKKNVNVLIMIFVKIVLKVKPSVKMESFINVRMVHGACRFAQIMPPA